MPVPHRCAFVCIYIEHRYRKVRILYNVVGWFLCCSYTAEAMTKPPGFCFCWAGVRATYGVCSGKVCTASSGWWGLCWLLLSRWHNLVNVTVLMWCCHGTCFSQYYCCYVLLLPWIHDLVNITVLIRVLLLPWLHNVGKVIVLVRCCCHCWYNYQEAPLSSPVDTFFQDFISLFWWHVGVYLWRWVTYCF